MDLDSYLGVHAAALSLREKRTELLATNLANADTPGYKARDLDFKRALEAATSSQSNGTGGTAGGLKTTQAAHIGASSSPAGVDPSSVKYRTPLAPSLDGNTVDPQLEQAAFAENAVRYQATLTFLSSRFRSLMTAITGQ
jgi:flagellar basal-body rod protein FlgB